jgi:predicted phosphatase
MDEALELNDYLPYSMAAANEQSYLQFLWSAFESNYQQGRYEFASLAFHLLYMSFVSFSIWQIRLARPDAFHMAMVGFRAEDEGKITECDSPFKFYEKLKESQIFRFLKLIGCNNDQVGEFAKFVKRRNKIAHPTGTVFFNDQQAIDDEIADMMREVRNIEDHMQPVITELYQRFLTDSAQAEELQYGTYAEEFSANFIHKAYMSMADLRHCSTFDVAIFQDHPGRDVMIGLHTELAVLAMSEDEMENA